MIIKAYVWFSCGLCSVCVHGLHRITWFSGVFCTGFFIVNDCVLYIDISSIIIYCYINRRIYYGKERKNGKCIVSSE